MRMIGSTAILSISPIASYDVTCPTDTWGSRNVALLAAITMSASATKCSPPPATVPLTAAITGFHTLLCHAVKRELGVARATRLLAQRVRVAAQLGDVEAGLERAALARVHDHAHRGIGVELVPRRLELVHHRVVHRVADLGRLNISQPTGPSPFDDAASRRAHRQRPRKSGSASRGTPRGPRGSPRSATTAPSRTPRCWRWSSSSDGSRPLFISHFVSPSGDGRARARAGRRARRRWRRARPRARRGGPSPSSAASAPSTTRPSSSISRARTSPMRRGSSQVAPLSGVKPRSTNGIQKRASSAATVKSAASARLRPMPAHQPCTRHTTGVCVVRISGISRCACDGSRRWMLPTRGSSPSPGSGVARHDVEAGAEVLAVAGDQDDAHRFVAAGARRPRRSSRPSSSSLSALRLSGRVQAQRAARRRRA